MARLVYTAITSLDGYVADAGGNFDWAAPDAEVHAFVNDLERPVGTYLCGRRLYETMAYWNTVDSTTTTTTTNGDVDDAVGSVGSIERDFARIWQAADKVVYSTTLEQAAVHQATSPRTTLERMFDPDGVGALVAAAASDMSIGGPHLAAHALRAGIVDEIRLFRAPVVIGGGTSSLPSGIRLDLTLRDHRRFAGGFVYLAYSVRK